MRGAGFGSSSNRLSRMHGVCMIVLRTVMQSGGGGRRKRFFRMPKSLFGEYINIIMCAGTENVYERGFSIAARFIYYFIDVSAGINKNKNSGVEFHSAKPR
jgi:hypothetical protein